MRTLAWAWIWNGIIEVTSQSHLIMPSWRPSLENLEFIGDKRIQSPIFQINLQNNQIWPNCTCVSAVTLADFRKGSIDLFHGRRGHCVAWQNPRNPHRRIGWLVNEMSLRNGSHLSTTQWACADFGDFAKQHNGRSGREKDLLTLIVERHFIHDQGTSLSIDG
jgi:hypothetical protein